MRFVRIVCGDVHIVSRNTDFVASLAKGLRVLELFGAERPAMSVSQVAAETGFDRATARRCLLTLHQMGYAQYDGKYFSLGPRALRLGVGALASLPLARQVQPWLDQVSDRIGQSSSVSILDDTEIVYIARAAQKRVMSIGLMPGSRLPAHCTSMGRVLLAALPENEARAVVERSELAPRTRFSVTEPAEIMARIDEVRRQGHALIDQEVELGLRSLAVPLLNVHGQTVAALNVGMAAIHDGPEALPELFLPDLQRVQRGLQREIWSSPVRLHREG